MAQTLITSARECLLNREIYLDLFAGVVILCVYIIRIGGVYMEAHSVYNTKSARKPVNLTANSDLIEKAKSLGINLSAMFEKAVAQELKRVMEEQWRKESKAGIQAYNQRIDVHGVFGAETRRF